LTRARYEANGVFSARIDGNQLLGSRGKACSLAGQELTKKDLIDPNCGVGGVRLLRTDKILWCASTCRGRRSAPRGFSSKSYVKFCQLICTYMYCRYGDVLEKVVIRVVLRRTTCVETQNITDYDVSIVRELTCSFVEE
jgi:hypothetical protein